MVCLYFLEVFKLKTARGLFLFTALTVFQRRRTERCAIVFIYLFTIMYVFVQTAKLCLNLNNIFTVDVLLIRFEPLGNGLRKTLTTLVNGHFPAQPVLAGTRSSPFWMLLELRIMKVVSGDSWSYKTCKAPVKSLPPIYHHHSPKHFTGLMQWLK